jgi:DnaJ-domain-containing protein 1
MSPGSGAAGGAEMRRSQTVPDPITDYFAILQEPRRPWLNEGLLKDKFLAISGTEHPDKVDARTAGDRAAAQSRYTNLNAAYQCLRDPKLRLQHLLELERGAAPPRVQNVPPDLLDLFMQVSQVLRQADSFLAENAQVTSPLLQVRRFELGQIIAGRIQQVVSTLSSHTEALSGRLREIDAVWETGMRADSGRREDLLQQVEVLCQRFSYFSRWTAQLQERRVRLTIETP